MNICSFDVGIKNLAICILKDSKIIKWDIINLINEIPNNNNLCQGLLKNNSKCTKKALFTTINNSHYYCGTHKKNYDSIETQCKLDINASYQELKINKVNLCSYVNKNNITCNKKANITHNNLHKCKSHATQEINSKTKELKLIKIKKPNANKTSLQLLAETMFTKLDTFRELDTVNLILIENQPSLKNPTMKSVATLLFSYFIFKKLTHKTITEVKFICPSNKLKVDATNINSLLLNISKNTILQDLLKELIKKYNNNVELTKLNLNLLFHYLICKDKKILNVNLLILIKKIEKDNNIYKITKSLSVVYTKMLLTTEKQDNWLAILDNHTKKDDMCDSYLQAIYYLKI
jgi:hypothetical protein